MAINIAKQIIDQRVDAIMRENESFFAGDDLERRKSKTFLLLGVAAYLRMELVEAYSYITDGGADGGFDAAYLEEQREEQIHVVLFQSKYTRNLEKESVFPANAVEKAVNTVRMVFDPACRTELNEKSRRIVDEIQSLILDGYIPYVTFVMVNNGDKWGKDAQQIIDNAFGQQAQVRFEHFGFQDILGYIGRPDPIKTNLVMSGAAIQENFNYKRVILGKVNISEIKRLMEQYGDRLLEQNIRKYLGRNAINESIAECLRSDDRANFFFYNNGITMICRKFSYNALQEKNWNVKAEGLQIINGAQTCRTIFQTLGDEVQTQWDDVYVLVRIYEVNEEEDIVSRITYATNHQNPVDLKDLKANDQWQKILEMGAKDLGYVYKRKKDHTQPKGAIPVSVAAEAVFAIWRFRPHLAKYKKAELFGAYYDIIFTDLNAAQMILAVLVLRYCDTVRKKDSENPDIQRIRPYSNYFVACMVGNKLLLERRLPLRKLTHQNFEETRGFFEEQKAVLVSWAESRLAQILYMQFGLEQKEGSGKLLEIDGRTLAAVFRRFDIVEQYLKTELASSPNE